MGAMRLGGLSRGLARPAIFGAAAALFLIAVGALTSHPPATQVQEGVPSFPPSATTPA
jgi:hypothetical protein